MDNLTTGIQDKVPWYMLFADDILLISESRYQLNSKLKSWRKTLESTGIKISRSRIEYLKCNLSGIEDGEGDSTKMGNDIVFNYNNFIYLGSIIESHGVLDLDIANRTKVGWAKYRPANKVL